MDTSGKDLPIDAEAPTEMVEPTKYRITGLSRAHRAVVTAVFILRVFVCLVLTQFGTRFLLVEMDYLNLVLNSLALTFILTIDNMLYDLLKDHEKEEMDSALDLEFESCLPNSGFWGYALEKECWGLLLAPILSVCLVLWFQVHFKNPVLSILECACLSQGSNCMESMSHQSQWWSSYWSKTLPAVMHQIEALRLSQA